MIKEAIQYIVGMSKNEMVQHEGKTYSTRPLNRLDKTPGVSDLTLRSLSGLVDYVKSNFDHEHKMMIHVESPTKVTVFDALDHDNDRRVYVTAKAMLPDITFGRYQDSESFNIMLQSCFVHVDDDDEENREDSRLVLKILSSIVEDETVKTVDDGLTQSVVAKTGVATVGEAKVPNPVTLKPFRTFVEVTQPASEFILRLQKGPVAALFEADGAAWELNAMKNIKDHLREELKELIESGTIIIVA